jgi:hypothetical protein
MDNTPSPAGRKLRAIEVVRPIRLSDEARGLLNENQSIDEFRSLLETNRKYRDAIRVAALTLKKQDAVWWGCLCLSSAFKPEPPMAEAGALQAAINWAKNPSEENRRAAGDAGDKVGADTPSGSLALAAFFSGGSIAPEDLPDFAPEPFLTAKSVASAVLIALDRFDLPKCEMLQRQALVLANDVASGRSKPPQ